MHINNIVHFHVVLFLFVHLTGETSFVQVNGRLTTRSVLELIWCKGISRVHGVCVLPLGKSDSLRDQLIEQRLQPKYRNLANAVVSVLWLGFGILACK